MRRDGRQRYHLRKVWRRLGNGFTTGGILPGFERNEFEGNMA
jgi:hypothetical protein